VLVGVRFKGAGTIDTPGGRLSPALFNRPRALHPHDQCEDQTRGERGVAEHPRQQEQAHCPDQDDVPAMGRRMARLAQAQSRKRRAQARSRQSADPQASSYAQWTQKTDVKVAESIGEMSRKMV